MVNVNKMGTSVISSKYIYEIIILKQKQFKWVSQMTGHRDSGSGVKFQNDG